MAASPCTPGTSTSLLGTGPHPQWHFAILFTLLLCTLMTTPPQQHMQAELLLTAGMPVHVGKAMLPESPLISDKLSQLSRGLKETCDRHS